MNITRAKRALTSKMNLMRPADGFLPLGLVLASLLGQSDGADRLFLAMVFTRLLSLSACTGLRRALSVQPSLRLARGSARTALLLQPLGLLLTALADLWYNRGVPNGPTLLCVASATLLNIEHVFYEYLFACGDRGSATRVRLITAAMVTAGLLMTGEALREMLWLPAAALLSAVLAGGMCLLLRDPGRRARRAPLNAEVIRCAWPATVQTLIYPLCLLSFLLIYRTLGRTSAGAFSGLMVYELCRSPFRRGKGEGRVMNTALLIVCAAAAAAMAAAQWAGAWREDLLIIGILLIVGAACGFAMFGNAGKRGEG